MCTRYGYGSFVFCSFFLFLYADSFAQLSFSAANEALLHFSISRFVLLIFVSANYLPRCSVFLCKTNWFLHFLFQNFIFLCMSAKIIRSAYQNSSIFPSSSLPPSLLKKHKETFCFCFLFLSQQFQFRLHSYVFLRSFAGEIRFLCCEVSSRCS